MSNTSSNIKAEPSFQGVGYSRLDRGFTRVTLPRSVNGVRRNMNDYIRKAVELVGWKWDDSASGYDYVKPPVVSRGLVKEYWLRADDPIILDALAAQLVRQVDALPDYHFVSESYGRAAVIQYRNGTFVPHVITEHTAADRTLNSIKAIVDSKVLERIEPPHE